MKKLEARVRFLRTEEGGRRTSVASGYRTIAAFDSVRVSAAFDFHPSSEAPLGESRQASVRIPDPGNLLRTVLPGTAFQLFEGAKKVAEGEVLEIIAM